MNAMATSKNAGSRIAISWVTLFALSGAIAPSLWLNEAMHDQYVGSPGSIFESLIPFFPTSLLFMSLPHPMNAFGWFIVGLIALLNVALYGLIGWLILRLALTLKKVWL